MNNLEGSSPYLDDLLHQSEALENTLDSFERANLIDFHRFFLNLQSGSTRRVVLTGMGSSYHALHPLMLGLLAAGVPAQMIETSELVHHAPALLSADTLIVAASQSGASAEILKMLEYLPSRSSLIGVTNTAGSPLADRADSVLLTRAGAESTVSCKTYITALAALALLEALLTGKEPGSVLGELRCLPLMIDAYLSGLDSYLEYLQGIFACITYLILAGRGISLAAAGTGALIIKEAAHFPTESISSASFRHGPLEMVSPQTFVAVFEGVSPTQSLNRNLVEDIQRMGGVGALIEINPNTGVFHLPPVSRIGLPVVEILPAQVFSLALANLHNHIPGLFTHGSKVTSVE